MFSIIKNSQRIWFFLRENNLKMEELGDNTQEMTYNQGWLLASYQRRLCVPIREERIN
jgi:hypothetical protein